MDLLKKNENIRIHNSTASHGSMTGNLILHNKKNSSDTGDTDESNKKLRTFLKKNKNKNVSY